MLSGILDSWEQLEKIVKDHFKYMSVQDAFEDVLEAERRWDHFLTGLDDRLKRKEGGNWTTILRQGDCLDLDMNLINARYIYLHFFRERHKRSFVITGSLLI